ncbi:MAG TPA: diphthine--ammonia ligase [Pyrinomonadaceae bacterium]|nr:diphthine--ammonia ligase [Pyrinomonadaceae bacterium]
MEENMLMYWSGGKDSVMALYEAKTNRLYSEYQVTSLLTTLTEGYDRISGHGVRRLLLEYQAECLGLNVHKTYIPKGAAMSQYEAVIEEALLQQKTEGTTVAATGDIFIEKRRMATFKRTGVKGCFPLMRKNSYEHMSRIIDMGFQAYVVCVDGAVLDQSFVGRIVDREFLNDLPSGVDLCGENGEYHTFVFDGPMFQKQVKCKLGEVVFRESFYFRDLLLDN